MFTCKHLALRRGTERLIEDINLQINDGQKVGVTGANGCGKSTLFAMILGQLQPDEGDFFLRPRTVIAHVAQETPQSQESALQYAMRGDIELTELRLEITSAELADDGHLLAEILARFDAIGGYQAESRAGKLLHGLGFSEAQTRQPVSEFSGGWRMRLNLAQALMCRSDLLLLDEPTNHLDLEAVLWLEDWLRAYPGTLLLISHDRDFLDRVVTTILNISGRRLRLYSGNYSAFERQRAEHMAQQQSALAKQQRARDHMQLFVDRFKAKASKAKQAQSRIKALEKMPLISQAHVESGFDFHFQAPLKLPNPLLRLDQARIGYAGKTILAEVNLQLTPGDRIGLLGFNGAGKSTLIKLLAGELPPQQGELQCAADLRIGYFAQHQIEQLDLQASPILHLQRFDARATEQSIRSFLGGFGFSNDKALEKVSHFSGGEKARLVLAMLVYQRPNLLLLDEPTNHLDLEMRFALSTALQEFEGAMVIVSHDRHLLRLVADRFLLVADRQVKEFDGDLEDYANWVQSRDTTQDSDAGSAGNLANKKQQRQDAAVERQRLKPLRDKVLGLEREIDRLNREKAALLQQLAAADLYQEGQKTQLQTLLGRQAAIEKQLDELEVQWVDASEELDSA